jgi:hypothetical protein
MRWDASSGVRDGLPRRRLISIKNVVSWPQRVPRKPWRPDLKQGSRSLPAVRGAAAQIMFRQVLLPARVERRFGFGRIER